MRRPLILTALFSGLILQIPVYAQWTAVAPGIAFREMHLPGPVKVFLARADRAKRDWTVDTMTSLGTVKGGRETVPDMARRCDNTVTWDGHRYEVKVAINGDYFNPETGYAFGGQFMAGWFVKRYGDDAGLSGFAWTSDRRCILGGDVHNNSRLQRVIFSDKTAMNIDRLNDTRKMDELALFTPQYDATTGTGNDGVEVLVRLAQPLCINPKPPGVPGVIVRINKDAGSTPIPFDCVVISAAGTTASKLRAHVEVGRNVYFDLRLEDVGIERIRLKPADWSGVYASMGNTQNILVDGYIPKQWEAKAAKYAAEGKKHGSVVKDPRTVIACNKEYLYFAVIDGRSEESIGMTFTETAEFCKQVLKADYAALQDGGGSSTLWVDGKVRNTPSGKGKDEKQGTLRAVANGYLIAIVRPPEFAGTFKPGGRVRGRAELELRLGPGTQYAEAGKSPADRNGQILPHALDGVFAKGVHWWFCRFGELEGWVAEPLLAPAS